VKARMLKLTVMVNQLFGSADRCNCIRDGSFHCGEEMERVLSIPCPVHGQRKISFIMYAPKWKPLSLEFRWACQCPPHEMRDRLARADEERALSKKGRSSLHLDQVKSSHKGPGNFNFPLI
jgi:hypothetical protein